MIAAAFSIVMTWVPGMDDLATVRLDAAARPDPELQSALEGIDRTLGEELGIPADDRRAGLVDLTDGRFAMVRGDDMMYGSIVPKIGVLLGWFEMHPESASSLDPAARRDLELMIKRSDDELAAKYGRIVGIDRLQEVYRDERYRLYDAELGGGLWSGQHYGLDEPRAGDPLRGLSHAATVRQLLRFYLMLEQGRLGGEVASARMKEILAAPRLDFHHDGFVAGLRGRNVGILRTNGRRDDCHLDAARIEHGDRAYALAGLVHHARGLEYLERLAAEVDVILCGPAARKRHVHHVSRDESVRSAAPEWTSAVIDRERFFNEVLLSWNVDVPQDGAFVVDLRVGRRFFDTWSPWLRIGSWGVFARDDGGVTRCDEGRVDVDVFRSSERFDRVQYRIRATDGAAGARVTVRRTSVCLSDTTGLAVERPDPQARDDRAFPVTRLGVPFRSQRAEDPSIQSRICSPTSVAMLLAFRGVVVPTAEVAARLHDRRHDIYGNWERAVQGAYSFGVPGYLARFSDWDDVEAQIAAGQPLVISISVKEEQKLDGAPYEATAGHLLVLAGFDDAGDVAVNDPAALTPEHGLIVYRRDQLEEAWLRRGGVAYVFTPPFGRDGVVPAADTED